MGMQKHRIISVTAIAFLALAACGTESGSGAGSGSGPGSRVGPEDSGGPAVSTDLPLTDVHWTVEGLSVDGKKAGVPAGAGLEIGKDGQASFQTGCNHSGAKVKISGDTITVGEAPSTAMSCSNQLDAYEADFGKAFAGRLKAEMADDNKGMTLTAADGDTITLTSEPSAALVGTWTLATLKGDSKAGVKVPKAVADKVYITFAESGTDAATGTARGNLGCNRFSTTTKVSGPTVTFGRVTTTRMACGEPQMTVEREMRQVLKGKVTYKLNHAGLSLTAADGASLTARPGARS
jgi:heat shock protein HslJ